jgi:hypothetical protein
MYILTKNMSYILLICCIHLLYTKDKYVIISEIIFLIHKNLDQKVKYSTYL